MQDIPVARATSHHAGGPATEFIVFISKRISAFVQGYPRCRCDFGKAAAKYVAPCWHIMRYNVFFNMNVDLGLEIVHFPLTLFGHNYIGFKIYWINIQLKKTTLQLFNVVHQIMDPLAFDKSGE